MLINYPRKIKEIRMDLERLGIYLEESGVKKARIAEALGISETSLRNKLNGKTPFLWREIVALSVVLRMNFVEILHIFFGIGLSETDNLVEKNV